MRIIFNPFVIGFSDGAGGKGTWGKLLDTDGDSQLDRNDPNYDSGEVGSCSYWCCLIYAFVVFNQLKR